MQRSRKENGRLGTKNPAITAAVKTAAAKLVTANIYPEGLMFNQIPTDARIPHASSKLNNDSRQSGINQKIARPYTTHKMVRRFKPPSGFANFIFLDLGWESEVESRRDV